MHNPEPTQIHFTSKGKREKERGGSVRETIYGQSRLFAAPATWSSEFPGHSFTANTLELINLYYYEAIFFTIILKSFRTILFFGYIQYLNS